MPANQFAICSSKDGRQGAKGAFETRRRIMLGTILLVILVLALIGAFPAWPHSRSWGYGPSGTLGGVLVILLILVLLGLV
jgi:hypothetical protein